MTERLVPVFNAVSDVQALLYRTMLQEAGIDVVERPLEFEWLEGVRQRALHSQLLVREEDAEQARALVVAFHQEAEEGRLIADAPDESQTTD